MKHKNIKLNFLILFFLSCAASALELPLESNFISGTVLCEKNKALIGYEKGFFTDVPLNYENLAAGTTKIYAWYRGGFDPLKPTLAYLTGGPGGTSHWGFAEQVKSMNILMIEPRGVGCSRAPTYSLYMDPLFYSSKFIAQDLEEIRKKLKLNKISVYGISYGTIPATIYASLFPSSVQALVLEGVVFHGGQEMWSAPELKQLFQSIIDEWKDPSFLAYQESALTAGIDSFWLVSWMKSKLMYNEGRQTILNQLNSLNKDTIPLFLKSLKELYGTPSSTLPVNDLFALNIIPYYMTSCQELGLATVGSAVDFTLEGRIITPRISESTWLPCQQLKVNLSKIYSAEAFPITVPVTYFQGKLDPATLSSYSYQHYQTVAKGQAQFLSLSNGGHNPSFEQIRNNQTAELQMFETALTGKLIPKSLIDSANSSHPNMAWSIY
jgi:proline iminopeptidase